MALAALRALLRNCKTRSADEILANELESVKGITGAELRQSIVDSFQAIIQERHDADCNPMCLETSPVVFLHPTKSQRAMFEKMHQFWWKQSEVDQACAKFRRADAELNYPQRKQRLRDASAAGNIKLAEEIRDELLAAEATLFFAATAYEKAIDALRQVRQEANSAIARAVSDIKNAGSIETLKQMTSCTAALLLVRRYGNHAENQYAQKSPAAVIAYFETSAGKVVAMGESWTAKHLLTDF
jgi:hypothetical protein